MWKDFKWVEKRFGTKFANILKGIVNDAEKGGQEIARHFKNNANGNVEYKDLNNVTHELITTDSFSSILAKNGLVELTWQELKNKRDNGQLIPGSLYRIIDYNCTTTQENTQSAGHQFDIVLLALSEDKLAEEGWAMMNESNIYDVTFADGVTKKCYLYEVDRGYNIIDVSTLLGCIDDRIEINETNKTAILTEVDSTNLTSIDLTYNYFQNSNLSAWKVWYCLDNDKSRFAWADDSVDEGNLASITINGFPDKVYLRDVSNDTILADINAYAWSCTYIQFGNEEVETIHTNSETPQIGDKTWHPRTQSFTGREITSYTPAHEGTNLPNGRGVIYRLIDEWNNDVAYDFKNIQLYLPIVDGKYVSDGANTWVYTFCLYNDDEGTYEDGSLKIIEVSVDDTYIVFNNIFMTANFDARESNHINFNVALGHYSLSNEDGFVPHDCIYDSCVSATSIEAYTYLYSCRVKDFVAQSGGIYCATKKVLTES